MKTRKYIVGAALVLFGGLIAFVADTLLTMIFPGRGPNVAAAYICAMAREDGRGSRKARMKAGESDLPSGVKDWTLHVECSP